MQTLFPVRCSIGAALMRISCSVLDLVLFRVISNSLHADILVIVCFPCYGFPLGLFCNLKQKIVAIYDRLLPTFPIRQIIDWRTYYGLWRFMIIFSLRFLGFMLYFEHTAFHILAAFIYAGVLLCWDGGFRLYMYPRVGLASSPVPARACSTTRSTMRVSSEDTESSDLHVHAGYPVTD